MDNITTTLLYFLPVQETGNSQWGEPDFSLEIDFLHEKNIASALAHRLSLGSYHILMKKTFYSLWSYLS